MIKKISIHSPRMGRDLSTGRRIANSRYFNPLSPHGERLSVGRCPAGSRLFQSTLPAWGETSPRSRALVLVLFQSTLPAWGETVSARRRISPPVISIHSPRMGRDTLPMRCLATSSNFNPLSPHGERLSPSWFHADTRKISIHSPRMGRDLCTF